MPWHRVPAPVRDRLLNLQGVAMSPLDSVLGIQPEPGEVLKASTAKEIKSDRQSCAGRAVAGLDKSTVEGSL
jgi:hypothetical protein